MDRLLIIQLNGAFQVFEPFRFRSIWTIIRNHFKEPLKRVKGHVTLRQALVCKLCTCTDHYSGLYRESLVEKIEFEQFGWTINQRPAIE